MTSSTPNVATPAIARIASRTLAWLTLFHITVIAASNYLVQLPVSLFGFHTTWGAFTFPLIFVATDLTVRILGAERARRVIFLVMFPALLLSYLISVAFYQGQVQPLDSLFTFNSFVARIAMASFMAYLLGQLLDIQVFNRLRKLPIWWAAPLASTVIGNLLDTISFFSLAFYHSSDEFMASHWVEIAWVDYSFKLLMSLVFTLPLYGILLGRIQRWLTHNPQYRALILNT
ncbi:7-cyano-7-deazaguanine/7-aminomethyl-7-deazaguanine transporter [Pokkaliibacter sp. MBI-7]|uniref:7-cyano-7-deazaguanine/7-aminomethyl-7- deazaguanine transporter n=1 Tax=Pokkaliibacter sp. MBI-7 TaxID=3040600 RepID=UPI00244A1648|nr:7-cyano-7-deazaguanine/7-aminomethyl-7-deazaguanine transporter [Pokkaliibacter sp. MBI-7]MDH2436411.1 7-cyano-7-deazaguanine/7-aminomethyl-7-deazaguanine transporter [Pokkaliibacter sp. MBI-7]